MRITVVAAVGLDGATGRDGELPWERIPGDLADFRQLTMGHAVVCGIGTWRSLPEPQLDGRDLAVLTTKNKREVSCALLNGRDKLSAQPSFNHAVTWAERIGHNELFVIGGAEPWHLALQGGPGRPPAQRMILTHVLQTYPDADAWFPPVEWADWQEELEHRATYWQQGLPDNMVGRKRLAVRRNYARRS